MGQEDGKVKNETVGKFSDLPEAIVKMFRRSLRGEALVDPGEGFETIASRAHGDGAATMGAVGRLKARELLGRGVRAGRIWSLA